MMARWRLRVALVAALVGVPWPAIAFPLDLVNCHIEFVDQACLGYDAQFGQDRAALLQAIDHSLDYLTTEAAVVAYGDYPLAGVTQDRVQRSLVRFRQLVATSHSAQQLQASVSEEFEFYRSVGSDGAGHVDFTGYFEPTYSASAVPTSEYRYPLYGRPVDLETWQLPHPSTAVALTPAPGPKTPPDDSAATLTPNQPVVPQLPAVHRFPPAQLG